MARSSDPRHPLPAERGPKRTGPIGSIVPGDDLEVARDIQRLWQALDFLKIRQRRCCDTGGGGSAPGGSGIIGQVSPIDLALDAPGNHLFRYKMGEAVGALIDSVGGLNLGYVENNPANGGAWQPGVSDLERAVLAHAAFGEADDGCVNFRYNQPSQSSASPGTPAYYPGSWFQGGTGLKAQWGDGVTGGSDGLMRSLSVFFQPHAGGIGPTGVICASDDTSTVWGAYGWRLSFDTGTRQLTFRSLDGGNRGPTLVSPGALAVDKWWNCVITVDVDTDEWRMYLNGVLVASVVNAYGMTGVGTPHTQTLSVGHSRWGNFSGGGADQFFYGLVDDMNGWGVTLTPAQVAAVWHAVGVGTEDTTTTVTIGAGASDDPYAVSSGFAAKDMVLSALGDGGTTWAYPKLKAFLGGVLKATRPGLNVVAGSGAVSLALADNAAQDRADLTIDIPDKGVITAKLADLAVTAAKLENAGPGALGPIGGPSTIPVVKIDAKGRVIQLDAATVPAGVGDSAIVRTDLAVDTATSSTAAVDLIAFPSGTVYEAVPHFVEIGIPVLRNSGAGAASFFRLVVDGVAVGGDIQVDSVGAGVGLPVFVRIPWTPTAGPHDVKIQWYAWTGTTVTIRATGLVPAHFRVVAAPTKFVAGGGALNYVGTVNADSPALLWLGDSPGANASTAAVKVAGVPTFYNGPATGQTAGGPPAGVGAYSRFVGQAAEWADEAPLDFTSEWTIEFWMANFTQVADFGWLVMKGYNSHSDPYYVYGVGTKAGGQFRLWGGPAPFSAVYDTTIAIPTGATWRHIVCTYKATGSMKLYIDGGAPVYTAAGRGDSVASTGKLGICRIPNLASNYETASIAGVALYNKELSQTRIQAHYDARANT